MSFDRRQLIHARLRRVACDTIVLMSPDDLDDRLQRWIADHRRVVVLTGAGCSTASGIPDYRDEQGEWKRRPPVMFQAFRTQRRIAATGRAPSPAGRDSRLPCPAPRITRSPPGSGPDRVALVTQNVDGLHQRAGSGT